MSAPTYLLNKIKSRCDEVGDCWLWKQGCSDSDMPQITLGNKTRAVRRVVYAEVHGEIPDGKVVSPKCGHKKCVSPECLEAVTHKHAHQNAARRGAHSSMGKIVRTALAMRARSHITEEVVQRIREFEGPIRLICAETGVSESHAKSIRQGKARRDFVASPFAGLGSRA
jgi:hypothetical protein